MARPRTSPNKKLGARADEQAYLRERARELRDVSAYDRLVASNPLGPLVLPANAQVYMRSRAGCAANTLAATVAGREVRTPLLSAGGVAYAGYCEQGQTLTPSAGFDILIAAGLGRVAQVGRGA